MEFAIIIIIVVFVLSYSGSLSTKQIYEDNKTLFGLLKEKDYDFLVKAKYGNEVNPDDYFEKRIQQFILELVVVAAVLMFNFTWINLIIGLIILVVLYRSQYSSLKSFYKKNLTAIDQNLPYYLKSIEILAQHYTIPVAISRSIETAPDMFKEGLTEMIKQIDAGDSSINPYLEFARKYPVGDSLRMMRLLYRLSIGAQENKQEQLSVFSKSVSSLQNKAREMKYASRLNTMEKKTMTMLIVTGGGSMLVLFFAMVMMMANWG
ncbi:MAG: hypothetical protein IJ068_01180 [Bacilli bacterium]|nr:hypothetical protein [Bacilli bacterium]